MVRIEVDSNYLERGRRPRVKFRRDDANDTRQHLVSSVSSQTYLQKERKAWFFEQRRGRARRGNFIEGCWPIRLWYRSSDEINGVEKCLCLACNISKAGSHPAGLVYLFGDQEDGARGFLTLLSSSSSSSRQQQTKGVFPLSALGSLGTARWDHHGDRRPHTFIPRDVSPWSYASLLRPCPASLIPNFLLYDRPSVRSFHPGPRRSSDWARSHLPSEDPRRSQRGFSFDATRESDG